MNFLSRIAILLLLITCFSELRVMKQQTHTVERLQLITMQLATISYKYGYVEAYMEECGKVNDLKRCQELVVPAVGVSLDAFQKDLQHIADEVDKHFPK